MKPKIVKKAEGKPKKDKSQSKRMKTFNSSQFSEWEEKNKALNASLTDLTALKQQMIANRKAQNNSALSQHPGSKGNTTKINLPPKKKKKPVNTKSKPKIKKIDQQQFLKAKYKQSNTHSQIIFSNDETKRESCVTNLQIKNVQHAQSIYTYQPDTNLKLKHNIKKQYQRKVQAATKIQKIYRGYRIRKLLDKVIFETEIAKKKIMANSRSEGADTIRQNDTYRTFADHQAEILMKKLFDNKAMSDINYNHTMRPRVQDYASSDEEQQNAKKDENNYPRHKQDITQKQKLKIQNWMQNQQKDQQNAKNQSSQQDESQMYYRRQNPIYSQQQISHYLQSSEQEYQQQLNDAYQPDIIFETNEEYIQSRKSSLQNKGETVNKLSNKGLADIQKLISNDGIEDKIRKQLREQRRDEKNQERIKKKKQLNDQPEENQINKQKSLQISVNPITERISRNQNESAYNSEQKNMLCSSQFSGECQNIVAKVEVEQKIINQIQIEQQNIQQKVPKIQKIHQVIDQTSRKQNIPQQKIKEEKKPAMSPRRDVQYLQQQFYVQNSSSARSGNSNKSNNSNTSKKSLQQQQIMRLRLEECQKWQQVIRMVNQQIKRTQQSNGEMTNFMQSIMDFSQKNKQLLASTRSVNLSDAFTTPTSVSVPIFNSNQKKISQKQQNIDKVNDPAEFDKKQQEDDSALKFFKKKKPLKIDVSDKQQDQQKKQILFSEIYDNKPLKNKQEFKQKQFVRSKRKKHLQFPQKSPSQIKKQNCFSSNERKNIKNELQSCLQNSKNIKQFLTSNIQVQDSAIYDILKLREQLLQKRQSQQLMKLNKQLSNNQLNQEQFLQKLSGMTRKFLQEKESIDKAKQDIIKGYQAANDLVKQYFFDVRRMGIKLAVSRSQDNLKYKFSQPSYVGDIKIDELTPKSTPKSANNKRQSVKQIFEQHQIQIQQDKSKQKSANAHIFQSSQDNSIDFTEEQLKRFRKAANYDLQFNNLNRNMTTMSDQFIRQQQNGFNDQPQIIQGFNNQSPESIKFTRNFQPHKQMYQLQQQKVPSARTPPQIQKTIQNLVNMLMWEFSAQLLIKPAISDKFIDRITFIKPSQISNDERLQFLKILQQNLPQKSNLHRKLNQNITPMPSQILKCMRLDFSQQNQQPDNQDDNYEEINKYQFVISQQSCAKSIMLFKNKNQQCEKQKQIQQTKKNNQISTVIQQYVKSSSVSNKIMKFITQREKFIQSKKQHTRQLRWEVMNIELHCIFDSWNQQIIQICSARAGFSGIGLNQLTLSMINHNKPVVQEKVQQYISDAKSKVIQVLTDDTDINAKILRQNFHQMCEIDSAWIFYADQALSYALQLVYLVEQDLYIEIAKQFRKIVVKNSLV